VISFQYNGGSAPLNCPARTSYYLEIAAFRIDFYAVNDANTSLLNKIIERCHGNFLGIRGLRIT